jgi:cytochrome c peroxidase
MRWAAWAWAWGLTLASATHAATPALLDFTPDELHSIRSHGPWPPVLQRDLSNRVDGRPAAVQFGRQLFFDTSLSASGAVSCASCHLPAQAFQDGLRVPASPARGQRNTPSLLDVAQQRWFGWDGAHDSLWAASVTPLLAGREMAASPAHLAGRVRSSAPLRTAYRRSFGQQPPADDQALVVNLGKALAAYQATLVSPRTAFDHFRDALARNDQDSAARYTLAAQRGLRIFIGAGNCSVCHTGANFSNGEFADIGVPFFVPGGVDAGRHAGLQRLLASPLNRLGPHNDAGAADPRAVQTRHLLPQHRNFGEFRVPGLRQLPHTAPYMHGGSLATIDDVVRHYNELNEERLHADGERILRPLKLDAGQALDLAAFLRSLGEPAPR